LYTSTKGYQEKGFPAAAVKATVRSVASSSTYGWSSDDGGNHAFFIIPTAEN
jgi:hypothetical protein